MAARPARDTGGPAPLDSPRALPSYRRPAPRTTGRELFHLGHLRAARGRARPRSPEDALATLRDGARPLVRR